jgi:cholesterol oxidase
VTGPGATRRIRAVVGRRDAQPVADDPAAATARAPSPEADEQPWPTVVIGSGFGGSVVAQRLGAEHRVLVLERGQPYPPGSFPRTPREFASAFWDPHRGLYGLFEVWRFNGLDMVCSSGLGGGSLIYANVLLRKDDDTFVREDLAAGGRERWPITAEELAPHYDNVRAMLAPQRFPFGAEGYRSVAKAEAMRDAAQALGLDVETTPLAVLFSASDGQPPVPGAPVTGENLHGNAPRSTCRLCGECNIGCNFGAKNTLDYTYLSAAKAKHATLRTCCEVRTIEPLERGNGGFRVGYVQHLPARNGHPGDLLDATAAPWRTVRADRVILAAGAVGTTRLLLANRAALPGLSPALGTRVSANGDAIAWVRHAKRDLEPSRGPVITSSISVPAGRSVSGRGYRIQDAGAPVLGDWFWQLLELPKLPWRQRRTIARMAYERIIGRPDTNLSGELASTFGDEPSRLLPLLGMGRDVPDGRYVLENGRLDLDWSHEPSDGYYDALHEGFGDVAKALGGELTKHPKRLVNRTTSVHPLGGCPMGANHRQGVVDEWGAVFGFANLYVVDGSAMPGAVGANPSFTIAAFADRVAERILHP